MKMTSTLHKISTTIVGSLERFFAWYGHLVSRHPWKSILICLTLCGLCGLGFLNFTEETNNLKLWVPTTSDFVANNEWLEENFPQDTRYNNVILGGQDVLTPEVIRQMFQIHQEVSGVRLAEGDESWKSICRQLPVIALEDKGYVKKESTRKSDCTLGSEDYDPSVCLYPEPYCQSLEKTTTFECFETSILELWGYDDPQIYERLTREDILAKVNEPNPMSKVFKRPLDVSQYLSLTWDEDGEKIIGATATTMTWLEQVNTTSGETAATGLPVNPVNLEFETLLYDIFSSFQKRFVDDESNDVKLFLNVGKAYDDIAAEAIVTDVILLPVGFTIVFIYVGIVLGRFSCVETRFLLASAGLSAVGLTILVSYGLCSAFGLDFGPMHNSIPFLVLGIGIDDMFVIMQCFDNIRSPSITSDHSEHISLAMKKAGAAITVTSLTDFIVFAIGSTTTLPSLRSFCLYCAIGILAIYALQSTFFVACLALHLKRTDKGRNGLCLCYQHKDYEEKAAVEGQSSRMQKLFEKLAKVIVHPIGKVLVILTSIALLGGAIYGLTKLQVRFESRWFLPPDSYLFEWIEAKEQYFPGNGEVVTVYLTSLDYPNELDKIESLVSNLENSTDIVRVTNEWYSDYKKYLNHYIGLADEGSGIPETILSQEDFDADTSQFLTSPLGSRWQLNFFPESPLVCGQPLSSLELTTFTFTHNLFTTPDERISAMRRVMELIDQESFSQNVFPIALEYSNWETEEVILNELIRNLALSMACIFITTLILLASFQGSVLVMLCVLLTLVDVLGFLFFWDLTIDVVSGIIVIISIGLCVDYSAHIAHTFLTEQGSSRNERVISTLRDIGPAVFSGGLSTFIALSLLATSDSHVFKTFFRVFFLVIVFGVFHGLVLLPVVLSLVGPSAYDYDLKGQSEKKAGKRPSEDAEKAAGRTNQGYSSSNL